MVPRNDSRSKTFETQWSEYAMLTCGAGGGGRRFNGVDSPLRGPAVRCVHTKCSQKAGPAVWWFNGVDSHSCIERAGASLCAQKRSQKTGPFSVAGLEMDLPFQNRLAFTRECQPSCCTPTYGLCRCIPAAAVS